MGGSVLGAPIVRSIVYWGLYQPWPKLLRGESAGLPVCNQDLLWCAKYVHKTEFGLFGAPVRQGSYRVLFEGLLGWYMRVGYLGLARVTMSLQGWWLPKLYTPAHISYNHYQEESGKRQEGDSTPLVITEVVDTSTTPQVVILATLHQPESASYQPKAAFYQPYTTILPGPEQHATSLPKTSRLFQASLFICWGEGIPKAPCSCMVYTWALKGVP